MSHPDTTQMHEPTTEEKRHREAALDETLSESFPSSDPPSTIPNPDDHDAADPVEHDRRARKNRGPERRHL